MVGKWWCKEIHERRKEKDLSIVAKNYFAFATALLWH
jgi:hypothetical protein